MGAAIPGFKVVGNTYYVGTYDLGCYLIDTGAGLILVNTGAPGSYPLIKANIEALGFKTGDIKVLTSTHGHWDHVGDLALFQKDAPTAKTYMSERDAPVLESGGNLDYRRPEGLGIIYDPIKVDVRTKPGDHITLGNTDMTVLQAYGHTPGATSFSFQVTDAGKTYNTLIVNMNGINAGVKLLGSPGFPPSSRISRTRLPCKRPIRPTSGCRHTPASSICTRFTSRATPTIQRASAIWRLTKPRSQVIRRPMRSSSPRSARQRSKLRSRSSAR